MIHQDLEQNPELILEIMKLSGLKNIELNNISPIELGSLSYCYLVKDTEKGDIICKIDVETNKHNFNIKKEDIHQQRQVETLKFQKYFASRNQNKYTSPNVINFYDHSLVKKLPKNINNLNVPNDLVGKNVFFMQKIIAKHYDTKKEYTQKFDKYYIYKYPKITIENIASTLANLHDLKNLSHNNISGYYDSEIPSIDLLNNFRINAKKLEKTKQYILSLLKNFTKAEIDTVKNEFCNMIYTKYGIDININNFDTSFYYQCKNIETDDILIGKMIVAVCDIEELLKQTNISKLNEHIKYISNKIHDLNSLPDTIIHNDANPTNFMTNEDKHYIIDFSRVGKNKRIYDLALLIKNNPDIDDDSIMAIINGYRIKGQGVITKQEILMIDDIIISIEIKKIIQDIETLTNLQSYLDVKSSININKRLDQIDYIINHKQNDRIMKIYQQTQNEIINALDLARPSYTKY